MSIDSDYTFWNLLLIGNAVVAMIVFTTGTYGVNSIILGWVAATCGQSKEKKATSLAIVNMTANASFIWTAVSLLLPPSPLSTAMEHSY